MLEVEALELFPRSPTQPKTADPNHPNPEALAPEPPSPPPARSFEKTCHGTIKNPNTTPSSNPDGRNFDLKLAANEAWRHAHNLPRRRYLLSNLLSDESTCTFTLPLVSREWRNGNYYKYPLLPFFHSLLTQGRLQRHQGVF